MDKKEKTKNTDAPTHTHTQTVLATIRINKPQDKEINDGIKHFEWRGEKTTARKTKYVFEKEA